MNSDVNGGVYWAKRPSIVLPTARCPLSTPKPGRPVAWEFIHNEGLGCYVHFWQGRTRPCVKTGTCDACASGQGPRFRFFIGAVLHPKQEVVIADLTQEAHHQLTNLVPAMNKLRGVTVTARRTGTDQRSKILVELAKCGRNPDLIPAEFDIACHLLKIWGMRELYKGNSEG